MAGPDEPRRRAKDFHGVLNRRFRLLGSRTPRRVSLIQALIAATVAICASVAWFAYRVVANLPGTEELRSLEHATETTTLYDAHERPIFTIPTQHRIEVPLSEIAPELISAIVAIEDQRFFEHEGIDHLRVIGAALTNLREGRAAQGASTITQQLARNSFLSRDKTLRRKLREVILAERLEHVYAKHEILDLYLNRVYFGDGLYGAEAAARGFFGKNASQLTLAEAALLAGLVRAPSATNPRNSLQRAVERRNLVLAQMRDQGAIDADRYEHATHEAVTLRDELRRQDPIGIHFKEHVRRLLIERFGEEQVRDGRLRVFTTLDPAMQQSAEAAVTSSLAELEKSGVPTPKPADTRMTGTAPPADPRLQVALLALEPGTREVRAMVGSRDVDRPGLNRAVQARRQPGSAFKPFVYASALEKGYSPATVVEHLDEPVDSREGAWIPEDEHSSDPAMTIRTALRTSSNRAAVHVLEQVGLQPIVSLAEKLGLRTQAAPSLALGSSEVTLLSLTSAYAAFADHGIAQEPVFIRRVEDAHGTVLWQTMPRRVRALSETTAFLMASMLADVLDAGTASRARTLGFRLPAAGKTGTTNDFADAWFIGFTPHVVAGVWIGFDRPRTIMQDGFAGKVAVPLWARFMKEATRTHSKDWFELPAGVTKVQLCRVSGQRPGKDCSEVVRIDSAGATSLRSTIYTEFVAVGTEPIETCRVHDYRPPDPSISTTVVARQPSPDTAPSKPPRINPTRPSDGRPTAIPLPPVEALPLGPPPDDIPVRPN